MLAHKLMGAAKNLPTVAAGPISVSYVTNRVVKGTGTLQIPTNTLATDICILIARYFTTSPIVVPSGWSTLRNSLPDQGTQTNHFGVFYRAGGAGSIFNTPSGSSFNNTLLVVLRPTREPAIALPYSFYNVQSGDPPSVLIPASGSGKSSFVLGYQRNTSLAVGFNQLESPAFQNEISLGTDSGATAGWSVYNSYSAVNHRIDVSNRGGTYNSIGGLYLTFN